MSQNVTTVIKKLITLKEFFIEIIIIKTYATMFFMFFYSRQSFTVPIRWLLPSWVSSKLQNGTFSCMTSYLQMDVSETVVKLVEHLTGDQRVANLRLT